MSEIGSKQNPPPQNTGEQIVSMVVADLEGRKKMGEEKYGQILRVENGRDALLDLYQELLDAVLYIRQKIEQETKLTHYREVVENWRKLVEYSLDEIYKLIPGEDTMENPDEYYERVTEGVLPMLFDTLRKRKEALAAVEAQDVD